MRDSLITRANVLRRVTFFSKKKSGESEQTSLANVGESGKSEQNRLANVGESGEYLPSLWQMLAHDKIGCFKHK